MSKQPPFSTVLEVRELDRFKAALQVELDGLKRDMLNDAPELIGKLRDGEDIHAQVILFPNAIQS